MLSHVPSAPRFLVDVFSFVVHAEFQVGILQRIFISQTTDFHFVSSHCVSCRFVSQTTESQIIRHDGGLKIANQPFAKQPSLHLSGLRDKFQELLPGIKKIGVNNVEVVLHNKAEFQASIGELMSYH